MEGKCNFPGCLREFAHGGVHDPVPRDPTPASPAVDERAEFDAWWERYKSDAHGPKDYAVAWAAWQAARARR